MRTSLQDRISWFSEVASLRPLLVTLVDATQEYPGHWQVLAQGLALHCLCRGAGINPHEILHQIERMERDVDAPFANQFRAMKEYAKGELEDA